MKAPSVEIEDPVNNTVGKVYFKAATMGKIITL